VILGTDPTTVLNSFCLSSDASRESPSAPIVIVSVNRMDSIFLSYRREDSEGQAGRLYDDLVAVFGSDSVFMDVAAIQPGRDFRKSIDQSLNSCGVFLSLIGKSWLTAKDTSGQRRLDDPADFVRIETGAALKRDIPVIPVLVQGASAPKPDQLPDDLKELAFRNAVELTHPRWDSDIQVLIKALRPHISQSGPKPEPERVQPGSKLRATKSLAVIAVLLVIVFGLALYLWPVKKVVDKPANPLAEITTTSAAVDSSVPGPIKRSPEKVVSPPATTNAASIGVDDFSLVARQEPLADNPKRYRFTLSLDAPALVDDIARVHYDLVYDPNPLSLEGDAAPSFTAVYEGWGCYETVVVTVYLKSRGSQPLKKTFNMCKALTY
jgi:TIR domain